MGFRSNLFARALTFSDRPTNVAPFATSVLYGCKVARVDQSISSFWDAICTSNVRYFLSVSPVCSQDTVTNALNSEHGARTRASNVAEKSPGGIFPSNSSCRAKHTCCEIRIDRYPDGDRKTRTVISQWNSYRRLPTLFVKGIPFAEYIISGQAVCQVGKKAPLRSVGELGKRRSGAGQKRFEIYLS